VRNSQKTRVLMGGWDSFDRKGPFSTNAEIGPAPVGRGVKTQKGTTRDTTLGTCDDTLLHAGLRMRVAGRIRASYKNGRGVISGHASRPDGVKSMLVSARILRKTTIEKCVGRVFLRFEPKSVRFDRHFLSWTLR